MCYLIMIRYKEKGTVICHLISICTEDKPKDLSGTVFSSLDYCACNPGLIPAGAEFPTGIQFWVIIT